MLGDRGVVPVVGARVREGLVEAVEYRVLRGGVKGERTRLFGRARGSTGVRHGSPPPGELRSLVHPIVIDSLKRVVQVVDYPFLVAQPTFADGSLERGDTELDELNGEIITVGRS